MDSKLNHRYPPLPEMPRVRYINEFGIGHYGRPDPLDAYRPCVGGVPVRPAQW